MNLSMVSYFDSTTKSAQLRVSLQEAPQREKKPVQMASYTFCFGIFCDSEQHHTWIQGMIDISK